MKTEKRKQIIHTGKYGRVPAGRQFYVFLFCIVLSSFFWLLVKMTRDFYYPVTHPLQYTGAPEGYEVKGYSDDQLTLQKKSEGYNWFSDRYLKKPEFIEVNLQNIHVMRKDGAIIGYLLTGDLSHEITQQLDLSSRPLTIRPDTLYFTLEALPREKRPETFKSIPEESQDSLLIDTNVSVVDSSDRLSGLEK